MVRCALAVVVLGAMAAPAAAQPSVCPPNVAPQFCKNFDDGVLEWNRGNATGDFEPARKLFQKALDFEKNLPGPYRYLADIAQKQSKFQDCLDYAVKVVKLAPDSPHAPVVRTIHVECRKGLNYPDFRQQFGGGGAISVLTPGIDGAKVKLNGLTMGATPFDPRPFALGPVDVEVEKKGMISAKATAEILPGLVTDVIFDMKEDPNAPKDGGGGNGIGEDVADGWAKLDVKTQGATVTWDGAAPKVDEQGRIRAKPGLHDVTVTAPAHDPWVRRVRVARGQSRTIIIELRATASRNSQRMKGWMALGAAAVFTAAGAGFAHLEGKSFEKAKDIWFTETQRTSSDADGHVIPLRTREDLQAATDKGKRYQLLSIASYGVAAAALGVSVWFFVHERTAERKGFAPPVALTPIFTPGDSGLGVQATYSKEIDW